MRRNFFTVNVLIMAAILLTACGAGGSGGENEIEVHDPRMNAAVQGENAVIYMEFHNHGSETDQISGVSSDAAQSAQLQQGPDVVDVIPAYANTETVFAPDGYHILLVGLKQDLQVGGAIEIVLHFRDRGDLPVTVAVVEDAAHGHGDH